MTPVVMTAIYDEDPSSIDSRDISSLLSNLVYFDYNYLRLAVDRQYAMEYKSAWNTISNNNAVMKGVTIIVGGILFCYGAYLSGTGIGALAGVPTMVFGADMILGGTADVHVLDEALTYGLKSVESGLGYDTAYMDEESFSFFRFTSDHITNLLLTQVTFMMISGALTGFQGIRNLISSLRGTSSSTSTGASSASNLLPVPEANGLLTTSESFLARLESLFKTASELVAFQYMFNLLKHLVTGTVMLYGFSALGRGLGDESFTLGLLFQLLFIAKIIHSYRSIENAISLEQENTKVSPMETLDEYGRVVKIDYAIVRNVKAIEAGMRPYELLALGLEIASMTMILACVAPVVISSLSY